MTNKYDYRPFFPDPKDYPHDYYLVWLFSEPEIMTRELLLETTFKYSSQIEYGGCCWRECADYFEKKYGYEYGS